MGDDVGDRETARHDVVGHRRHHCRRVAGAVVAAAQPLLGQQLQRGQRDLDARRRDPDDGRGRARPQDVPGEPDRRGGADRLERVVDAARRDRQHRGDGVAVRGDGIASRRAPSASSSLRRVALDSDHAAGAGEPGGRHELQPDAAAADDADGLADRHAGGVAHRADRGHHAAAEQRSLPQRQRRGHADDRCGRHHAALGEARDAVEVLHRRCRPGSAAATCRRAASRPRPRTRRPRTGSAAPPRRRGSRRTTARGRTRPDRPARRAVTPSPTASTTPAPSCPSTIGWRPAPMWPSARCRSEWQTPAAATRTSSSPRRGGSSSSSRTSSGRSYSCRTAARILIRRGAPRARRSRA